MASRDRPVKRSIFTLAAFLERGTLHRMAGARSFERGEDYFLNGQVKALTQDKGTITAKVQGTRPYQVELWIEEDDLKLVHLPGGCGWRVLQALRRGRTCVA